MRPYLRAANVTWQGLAISDVKEMDFTEKESVVYELRPGDLLLSEASGSPGEVGKPAMYTGEIDGCCFQNTLIRVRVPDALSPAFYEQYFREQAMNGQFAAGSRGVGIHHLGAKTLSDWPVPLPARAEQDRIVTKIEEAFSKLGAGEAGLRIVRKRLVRMRESVLTAAVSGELVSGRSGTKAWRACELRDVTALQNYGISAKAHEDPQPEDVPILRMGNIQGGMIDDRKLKYVAPSAKDVTKRLLQHGDLLFNRTNSAELVGKTAVYVGTPVGATFASYLIGVRLTSAADPHWCAAVMNSRLGRDYCASVVTQQVGQANVNGTKLSRFPIPLPPIEEQERIVAEVERQFSFIDACERAVDAGLVKAAALRRSVLKAAFEGKLVEQDPSDEPASVLLERIRAERAATSG